MGKTEESNSGKKWERKKNNTNNQSRRGSIFVIKHDYSVLTGQSFLLDQGRKCADTQNSEIPFLRCCLALEVPRLHRYLIFS